MTRFYRLSLVATTAFLVSLAISVIGLRWSMAETGPSASDVKAAMVRNGISAGAQFQLGERNYTLHNISVSKTGPESFVVSFVTK